VVVKASDAFKDKNEPMSRHWSERQWRMRPNQLWQTDFTYLKGEPLRRDVFETNGERLGMVLPLHDP
jgi:hypothetical protein